MLQDASGDLFFCCHYATAVLFPRVRFVHLTNVAIQKTGEGYNKTHGGKWRLKHLRLWVQGIYGQAAADKLFRDLCVLVSGPVRVRVHPRRRRRSSCLLT